MSKVETWLFTVAFIFWLVGFMAGVILRFNLLAAFCAFCFAGCIIGAAVASAIRLQKERD